MPCELAPLGSPYPPTETRPGTRLIVQPVSSPELPWSIDIVSTQVQAMLEGFLSTGVAINKRLGWRSRGFGSQRKDTIHLRPMNQAE
jgi:hypothetical protein